MFDPAVPEEARHDRLASNVGGFESTRLEPLMPAMTVDDETRRLEVLQSYHLIDTAPEPAFDDIVNMASLMCGTPIALVSLITEDRQWFKARVGLDQMETPRDQAFCAHAIRNPSAIMEVRDASKDPRFMHNPLVVGEPGIRFYAGAPLLTPSGAALGTVCVIDRVPRQLTPSMAQGLQALARQVGELLALRRANSDLETLNQSVMEMQVELEHYQVKLEGENAELAQSSPVDPVTGLNNQRAFERALGEELLRVEGTQSRLALLLAEIDHLGVFARDFGAVAKDDALRRVAKVVKAQARGYDTLACLDSRRFAMLLPGTDDSEMAAMAARLRRAVSFLPPLGRGLRVSIGAAVARPIDAPLDVMQRATSAVEQAMEQGGNQVVVASA
ncbi:MAG: diguanylate cyclase [Burkholderiales bacterium]|nr:diguanylate cyclase [Burkholderiales bacterium]